MAQMKRLAGCASEPIEIRDGSCLADLLLQLADHHGDAFRGMLLDESATPRKSLLFFVGDEHAEVTRPLHEGDAVTLLTPMAGG
jgi:molybdopterin converting factor small subunit